MNSEEKIKQDLQNRPLWVLLTTFLIVISTSPVFYEVLYDFFIYFEFDISCYKGFIQLGYILLIGIWFIVLYIKDKKEDIPQDKSQTNYNKFRKTMLRVRIRRCLIDIFTLRFIPLIICLFIKKYKNIKNIDLHFFDISKTGWEDSNTLLKENYDSVIRIYDENKDINYEIMFCKDFENINLRMSEKGQTKYGKVKKSPYKVLNNDVKDFSFLTPFGLRWNFRRMLKNMKKSIYKKYKKFTDN